MIELWELPISKFVHPNRFPHQTHSIFIHRWYLMLRLLRKYETYFPIFKKLGLLPRLKMSKLFTTINFGKCWLLRWSLCCTMSGSVHSCRCLLCRHSRALPSSWLVVILDCCMRCISRGLPILINFSLRKVPRRQVTQWQYVYFITHDYTCSWGLRVSVVNQITPGSPPNP